MKKTVELLPVPNSDDLILPLDEDILKSLNWNEGDTLVLSKKEDKIVLTKKVKNERVP